MEERYKIYIIGYLKAENPLDAHKKISRIKLPFKLRGIYIDEDLEED